MGFLDNLVDGMQKKTNEFEKRQRKNIARYSDEQIRSILRNSNARDKNPYMYSWVEDEARKRGIY